MHFKQVGALEVIDLEIDILISNVRVWRQHWLLFGLSDVALSRQVSHLLLVWRISQA